MGEFRRAASKVWTWDHTTARSSPGAGSQDSGFSDSAPPLSIFDHLDFSPLKTDTRLLLLSEDDEELSPISDPPHTSTPKRSTSSPVPKRTKARLQVCLLDNFNKNDSTVEESNCAVRQWLRDLAVLYEPECTTTLQSKSLAAEIGRKVSNMTEFSTVKVREVQERTRIIVSELAKLCRQLEYGRLDHVGPLVQSLVGHIVEFISLSNTPKEELASACERLRAVASVNELDRHLLKRETTELGQKFTAVVDEALKEHILALISHIENPPSSNSELVIRAALSSLTSLGLEGPSFGRLVADCGGIRALLTVCLDQQSSSVRTMALRALATVCSDASSIRQFEQAGGVEIISDILNDQNKAETELSEATSVLAQITSPWVEDNHSVQGLSEYLESLIRSLTRIVMETENCETLLLCSAALANLSHLEPRCVWPLLECATAKKLLTAVRAQGPTSPVFLREQAATLLANMAAVPETRPQLANEKAALALLCFLQVRPSPLETAAEIAASERLQQKSAIALSRLCSDPEVAEEVVQLQGVPRLVRLCREDRERNHSDGVLVACLAALRKIAANCGTKVIEDMDAMELVEPRLLDSFLLYSSRQESYV